jgi:hypothetical protein
MEWKRDYGSASTSGSTPDVQQNRGRARGQAKFEMTSRRQNWISGSDAVAHRSYTPNTTQFRGRGDQRSGGYRGQGGRGGRGYQFKVKSYRGHRDYPYL